MGRSIPRGSDCHMMLHYKLMRKTKDGLRSHRTIHQQQLCKLLLALPLRKLPQEHIEAEFDDRSISKAQLNSNICIGTQGKT